MFLVNLMHFIKNSFILKKILAKSHFNNISSVRVAKIYSTKEDLKKEFIS